MTLTTIIKKKKEQFEKEFVNKSLPFLGGMHLSWKSAGDFDKEMLMINNVESFLEKAIRESVEEALREVRPSGEEKICDTETGGIYKINPCKNQFDSRVKEFMK